MGLLNLDWALQNCEPKELYNYLPQVFCYSTAKLTNTSIFFNSPKFQMCEYMYIICVNMCIMTYILYMACILLEFESNVYLLPLSKRLLPTPVEAQA